MYLLSVTLATYLYRQRLSSIILFVKKIFLSVVIPCYDEIANLQKGVLDKVDHFLNRKKYDYEVIVVDDDSTDGSIKFVEEFTKENPRFRLIKSSHMGKAGAVTTGVLEAKGDYILFTDMDQATPIEEVDKLLPYFHQGFDIVVGSRNRERKGSPWTRVLMSRVWIVLRSVLVNVHGIVDTQCGFKMFTNEAAKKIFAKIAALHNGFRIVSGSSVSAGFDVELLYLAQKMRYKIKDAPVSWLYVETRRVNPIKDSMEGLFDLFRIKLNDIKGLYK